MNHGFNDISIDFSWALVRSNGDVVVMNISSWHVDLNMIGTQNDGLALSANVWTSWTIKNWRIFWGDAL